VQAATYDSDVSDALKTATKDDKVADEVPVSTSIRPPKPLLDRVRETAAEAGIPATTRGNGWT